MNVIHKREWELPEHCAAPESAFLSRRAVLAGVAGAGISAAAAVPPAFAQRVADLPDPTEKLYPVPRNEKYFLDRPITPAEINGAYNNFYEFGSSKAIARAARALKLRPWTIAIDGLVEKEVQIGIDDLLKLVTLEERLYRHRCVEAWSMAVPWSGFPMAKLVALARPLGSAKYVRMASFMDRTIASNQKQTWYPWPYSEAVTIAEATNELAFLVTGAYGKALPKQHGAPLRLALPWKYGFKSIKSITRFTFTEKRPVSFWESLQPSEYGFWANVNPHVAHPRWSQATETDIATRETRPTEMFNGYMEYVAHLYDGLEGEKLYL